MLGGVLVIKGEITIGGLSAFMMYNGLLIDPLVEIISLYQEMQKTWVSMKKINDIFNEPVSIYKKKAPKSKEIRLGEISFKNVSFSYKDDVPIIKDLNLQINSGEKVAIVGASGAGK
ncbi:MAG TPA: long-chain fatty acid--CoA ligase, partial [Clostridium sp.]|nr:long-chain fatty acid--CoA ligase [Clostridium sp.]